MNDDRQRDYETLLDGLTCDFTANELGELSLTLAVPEGDLRIRDSQRDWAASLLRLLAVTGRQRELYHQLRKLRPNREWPAHYVLPLNQTAHVYTSLPNAGGLPELTALTVPAGPHLHTRIGREAEYNALVDLLQRTKASKRGRTVCLLGRPGCGRRALMADVQQAALALGYHLAAVHFEEQEEARPSHGRVRWGAAARRPAAAYVAQTFPQTAKGTGGEWADLMLQLADTGAFAYVPPGSVADEPRALNVMARHAARLDPLLLCVENLDDAHPLWIDLLHDLAVHEMPRDLPLVLLIGMNAPRPLAELRGAESGHPAHTEPTRLAQKLAREGVADSHFLGPITADDLRLWIDPAEPAVADRLARLSGLDPKTAELIWLEWKAIGAVVQERGRAGRWVAAPGQKHWVEGDARDLAIALLDAALDGYDGDPYTRNQINEILACAALEGDVFHAEAVARVLELDAEELMEFLDTWLAEEDLPEDDGRQTTDDGQMTDEEGLSLDDEAEEYATGELAPEPLLAEAGFYAVRRVYDEDGQPREIYLHLYRFARPYLRLVWQRYGLSPARQEAQQRAWRKALAEAMERLYEPLAVAVAGKLIRLYEDAGEEARAESVRWLRLDRLTLEQTRRHVDALLADRSLDPYATARLFDVAFPFLNRWAQEEQRHWRVGLRVAVRVAARARCLGDEAREAEAWYYAAWLRGNGSGFPQALHAARRALAIRERILGLWHPDTAGSLNNLGSLLQAMGDLPAARPYLERALAVFERVLGPEHPHTVTSVAWIGHLLQAQGDYAAAKPYLEQVVAVRERVLGPEHPDTATSLNNLGRLLQAMDDLAAARPYYERALAVRERVLGPEHPSTALSLNNLGSLLQAMGDLAAARPYLERALAVYERVLGPEHPDTAGSLNNLGSLLQAMGDLAAARPYYERALAVRERVLGPEHPDTATSLNNLGGLLDEIDEDEAALEYYRRALAIREKVLGPTHPDTANSLHNTGALLVELGRPAEGRLLLARALEIYTLRLGPDHPRTKSTAGWLRGL